MSGHKGHDTVTAIATVGFAMVTVPHYYPIVQGAIIAGGLTQLAVNPDLDLQSGSFSFNWIFKAVYFFTRWLGQPGWWIAEVARIGWSLYWWPYAKWFSHRSIWSHFPVLSTAIRMLYLFWWFGPIALITWACGASELFLFYVATIMLGDALHWALDVLDKLLGGRL